MPFKWPRTMPFWALRRYVSLCFFFSQAFCCKMSACFSMAHFFNYSKPPLYINRLAFFWESNKSFVVFISFSSSTFVSRRRLLAPNSVCSRRLLLQIKLSHDFQSVVNSTALLHSLSLMISPPPNDKMSCTVSSFIGSYKSLNQWVAPEVINTIFNRSAVHPLSSQVRINSRALLASWACYFLYHCMRKWDRFHKLCMHQST